MENNSERRYLNDISAVDEQLKTVALLLTLFLYNTLSSAPDQSTHSQSLNLSNISIFNGSLYINSPINDLATDFFIAVAAGVYVFLWAHDQKRRQLIDDDVPDYAGEIRPIRDRGDDVRPSIEVSDESSVDVIVQEPVQCQSDIDRIGRHPASEDNNLVPEVASVTPPRGQNRQIVSDTNSSSLNESTEKKTLALTMTEQADTLDLHVPGTVGVDHHNLENTETVQRGGVLETAL